MTNTTDSTTMERTWTTSDIGTMIGLVNPASGVFWRARIGPFGPLGQGSGYTLAWTREQATACLLFNLAIHPLGADGQPRNRTGDRRRLASNFAHDLTAGDGADWALFNQRSFEYRWVSDLADIPDEIIDMGATLTCVVDVAGITGLLG